MAPLITFFVGLRVFNKVGLRVFIKISSLHSKMLFVAFLQWGASAYMINNIKVYYFNILKKIVWVPYGLFLFKLVKMIKKVSLFWRNKLRFVDISIDWHNDFFLLALLSLQTRKNWVRNSIHHYDKETLKNSPLQSRQI